MFIFVDESGSFKIPNKPNRVSCVTALVIPESFAVTVFRKFRKKLREWNPSGPELKGSSLSEKQTAELIHLIKRFDVLVVSSCIDMGLHTEDGITAHKNDQADKVLRAVEGLIHPSAKKYLEGLSTRVRSLSNQLYVQALVLNDLIDQVLRSGTLYYSQRIPATLGAFRWRIDAKDTGVTPYESLWKEIVLPFLQYNSLKEPLLQLKDADYSAFNRFHKESTEPPDYLREHVKNAEKPFLYLDLREILMADLQFRRSDRYSGIQLVDMIASIITRACNGALQKEGWENVGRLMVQNEKGKNALSFLALGDLKFSTKVPYKDVVKWCDRDCKKMLTKDRYR